jgi:hypothetical protein
MRTTVIRWPVVIITSEQLECRARLIRRTALTGAREKRDPVGRRRGADAKRWVALVWLFCQLRSR